MCVTAREREIDSQNTKKGEEEEERQRGKKDMYREKVVKLSHRCFQLNANIDMLKY